MGRRKSIRKIHIDKLEEEMLFSPKKPILNAQELTYDEIEAMRLCDLHGLYQNEAAKAMGISRSTLARILFEGRKKIIIAVLKNCAIKIVKGNVSFEEEKIYCPIHESRKRKGRFCLCSKK